MLLLLLPIILRYLIKKLLIRQNIYFSSQFLYVHNKKNLICMFIRVEINFIQLFSPITYLNSFSDLTTRFTKHIWLLLKRRTLLKINFWIIIHQPPAF